MGALPGILWPDGRVYRGEIPMSSNKVIIASTVTLVVVAAVDALRSSGDTRTSPHSNSSSPALRVKGAPTMPIMPDCGPGDVSVRVAVRQPTASQAGSESTPTRHRRVATIVVRTVGDQPCRAALGRPAVTIRDRGGRTVGEQQAYWFHRPVTPGSEKTFPLPTVYFCDRPGPFVVVATVGLFSTRRGGLTRRQIGC
jgi:hypothetical protein